MRMWYLRHRGDVLGPYTADELATMRERREIGALDEVSLDQRDWHPLTELDALAREAERAAAAPAIAPPAPGTRPAPARRQRGYALLVGAIVVLVLLGLLVVAVLLARQELPWNVA